MLIVDDKGGTYWFLENYPNNRWAYIEHDTRQPIDKAVTELLESRVRS